MSFTSIISTMNYISFWITSIDYIIHNANLNWVGVGGWEEWDNWRGGHCQRPLVGLVVFHWQLHRSSLFFLVVAKQSFSKLSHLPSHPSCAMCLTFMPVITTLYLIIQNLIDNIHIHINYFIYINIKGKWFKFLHLCNSQTCTKLFILLIHLYLCFSFYFIFIVIYAFFFHLLLAFFILRKALTSGVRDIKKIVLLLI